MLARVKYMLLVYQDETAMQDVAPGPEGMKPWLDYSAALNESGVFQTGMPLDFTSSATTVRVRDDERVITDGPFAETKEQLGGFYVLECKDLDEALDWAARCPGALYGSIEVRPIPDFPGMDQPTA